MLHNYGFEVILSCCDVASSNRSFIDMNSGGDNSCFCQNPFSGMPIFFYSDPPHLIKKFRNNLYNSGDKSEHARYTRTLLFKGKYILWDHVYSVYRRETQRHLYATDLRKAHVCINSVSTMWVKLAVETLSLKVVKEMEECNKQATSIFNDHTPIKKSDDNRLTELDAVVQFFQEWEIWLSQQYKKKSEQAKHFISWQTKFDFKVSSNALLTI